MSGWGPHIGQLSFSISHFTLLRCPSPERISKRCPNTPCPFVSFTFHLLALDSLQSSFCPHLSTGTAWGHVASHQISVLVSLPLSAAFLPQGRTHGIWKFLGRGLIRVAAASLHHSNANLSHICDLHHSSGQHRIPDPLSKVRD